MNTIDNTSKSELVKHSVIIIPALKTNNAIYEFMTRTWRKKYGMSIYILNVWNTEKGLPSMLEKVVNQIDDLSKYGDTISLIGAAAAAI